MHIDPTRAMYYAGVHLLYASIVCLLAWILTSVRRGGATAKYWIWVATTLNFVTPLGAVADGVWSTHLGWATPMLMMGDSAGWLTRGPLARLFLGVWIFGATAMSIRLVLRLRSDRRSAHARATRAGFLTQGVPVRFAEGRGSPAVDGVLHPHISLPSGIDRLLSADELSAVLMHEVTHAKRRDNLIRLVYEITRCALWFHPLVWIVGARLALYRELSCDESVIQRARGRHLLSALRKLAVPDRGFLLQASATSFLARRVALLSAPTERPNHAGSASLGVAFGAVIAAGVLATIAHTACCFVNK
jgi:beta-lactamase regulating signal transducer with metallopeptidase domain